MLMLCYILLLAAVQKALPEKFPALDVLRPQVSREKQENAVRALLDRMVPLHSWQFQIQIDLEHLENDEFIIENAREENVIKIRGTSGPAVTYGINTYLRSCCNVQFSWDGQQIQLPRLLPPVTKTTIKTSIGRFRYFSNVCTFSYSFVWWAWPEWEAFIDWLALNGFNLVLAEVGSEAVWQNVWLKLGLNQSEIDQHFTGPAFLAWLRMGNLKGWGGPLSQNWHRQQTVLQQQVLERMVELGMVPVLPAFAGHVPDTLPKYFPNANISRMSCWHGFQQDYSCLQLVDPLDPLFRQIGTEFLREAEKMFGLYHAYDADPFNEMKPKSYEKSYIQAVAQSIFRAMTDADPKAIWIKQAWFFIADENWLGKPGEYFLTAIPPGRILLLDLDAYRLPIYPLTKSFYGQPFVWNMIHDYGGVLGLQGSGVTNALQYPNSTIVGTGLAMEGIFQNYVMYQFLNDRGWSEHNLEQDQWYKPMFVEATAEWRSGMFAEGKYAVSKDAYGLFRRPNLQHKLTLWYNTSILCEIWKNFTVHSDKHGSSYLYRLDLVDITREVLVLLGNVQYRQIVNAFRGGNQKLLIYAGDKLMQIFDNLESILSTHDHFLLGKWIRQARQKATNQAEATQYEHNFRNQLTLWGPNGEILDYARKQWAGIMKNYYKLRWALFIQTLVEDLARGKAFDQEAFDKTVFERVEKPFTFLQCDYPFEPTGDTVAEARIQFQQYYEACMKMVF